MPRTPTIHRAGRHHQPAEVARVAVTSRHRPRACAAPAPALTARLRATTLYRQSLVSRAAHRARHPASKHWTGPPPRCGASRRARALRRGRPRSPGTITCLHRLLRCLGITLRGATFYCELRGGISHRVCCAYYSSVSGDHEFDPTDERRTGADGKKAAVSAGCWTVSNADVASRKATCNCSLCSIAYSYMSLTTSIGASHEPPCTNPN